MKYNKVMLYLTFAIVLIFVLLAGLPPLDEPKGKVYMALLFYLIFEIFHFALQDLLKLSKKVDTIFYICSLVFLIRLFIASIVVNDIFVISFSLVFFVLISFKIYLNFK